MRIIVKRDDLLQQLPRSVRYSLLSFANDMPDTFVFEGYAPGESDYERMKRLYPAVRKVLTATEFGMFMDMHGKEEGAGVHLLGRHVRTARTNEYGYRNSIAAHVSNMRDTFKKNGLPFTIVTCKQSGLTETRYVLTKTA